MQRNAPTTIASTSTDTIRATEILRNVNDVFGTLVGTLDLVFARLDALESSQDERRQVVAFCERRSSWTVRQLASDLGMGEQTVRNYLALPAGDPMRLESFQVSKGSPHVILPEHVADWMRRSRRTAASV